MKKIRYGVIGFAGFGDLHCRFARQNENVELTAIVDTDAALVNRRATELGVRGFRDYRDMLAASVVDAVSIVTPHHLHAEIGLSCLNAGVHVYIEKPFANRVSEVDRMIAAAQSGNLKICVGRQYRLHRSSHTC